LTLTELLVAIAALALLAIMSWRGIDAMIRAQEAVGERTQQQAVLQTALAQWYTDLDAIMPLANRQALDWDGQVLRLTRRNSNIMDNGALVVAWSLRDIDGQPQWVRWQSPPVRTVGQWKDAWIEAAQWGHNPSTAQKTAETILLPLTHWEIHDYRGNAWSTPQSSNAQDNGSDLPAVPDGLRVQLNLPASRGIQGLLTVDWVNPLRKNNKND
jgi:general secretion pathway protein J